MSLILNKVRFISLISFWVDKERNWEPVTVEEGWSEWGLGMGENPGRSPAFGSSSLAGTTMSSVLLLLSLVGLLTSRLWWQAVDQRFGGAEWMVWCWDRAVCRQRGSGNWDCIGRRSDQGGACRWWRGGRVSNGDRLFLVWEVDYDISTIQPKHHAMKLIWTVYNVDTYCSWAFRGDYNLTIKTLFNWRRNCMCFM